MDVYPMQLIKSCMIEDIDAMEQLGIYEVSEEDMALCEFVCTSKMEVQNIIRKGLDLVKKECSQNYFSMKIFKNLLDVVKPHFENGGKLEKLAR